MSVLCKILNNIFRYKTQSEIWFYFYINNLTKNIVEIIHWYIITIQNLEENSRYYETRTTFLWRILLSIPNSIQTNNYFHIGGKKEINKQIKNNVLCQRQSRFELN